MANRIYPRVAPNPSAALGYDGTDFRVLLVDSSGHPLVVGTLYGSEGLPLKQNADGRLEVRPGYDGTNYLPLQANSVGFLTPYPCNDGVTFLPILSDSVGRPQVMPAYDGSAPRMLQSDNQGVINTRVGYDGATWRAPKVDSVQDLYTHPRPFKIVTALVALAAVAAGATRTEVDIDGNGFFMGFSHYMDGASVACSNTFCNVYLDGEDSPSIHVRCNSYNHDLINTTYAAAPAAGAFLSCPVGWGGHYDAAKFIYSGGFVLESHFTTSLKVDVVNGDTGNPTSIRTLTWYALWV